jgi:hypothetical protein
MAVIVRSSIVSLAGKAAFTAIGLPGKILHMRRAAFLCLLLLAACSSGPTKEDREMVARGPVQIIHRQYYRGSRPTIVENAAGRDIVKLRSRPLTQGEPYVTYVDDDVMAKLLNELRRMGFYDHAQARPADPRSLGARAEVVVVQPTGQVLSLVRMRGQSATVAEAYKNCALSVEAVQSLTLSPQATTSGTTQFGVRKVEK